MPEPLPSLGLNPPLQRGRLRVFVVASASQVRGRRALSKHRVDTSRERLTESCQLIRPGFPLTRTCFVCPAHRVTRRNRIFSSSPVELCLSAASGVCGSQLTFTQSVCHLRVAKESSGMWTPARWSSCECSCVQGLFLSHSTGMAEIHQYNNYIIISLLHFLIYNENRIQ